MEPSGSGDSRRMSPVSQGVFPPGRHTGRRMAVMGCLLLQVGVSAQPHHGCHSLSNGTHMPAPPGPFCNNPSIGGLDRAIQHFLYLPGLRQESGELRAESRLAGGIPSGEAYGPPNGGYGVPAPTSGRICPATSWLSFPVQWDTHAGPAGPILQQSIDWRTRSCHTTFPLSPWAAPRIR